jgi:hypothetical protein
MKPTYRHALLPFVLFAVILMAYGQTTSDSKRIKAQDILRKAKEISCKTIKPEDIKSFSVNYGKSKTSLVDFGKGEQEWVTSENSKFNWLMPDKFNVETDSEGSIGGNFTNSEQTKVIINGNEVYKNTELFDKDGQKITYFDANNLNDSKERKSGILSDAFDIFFPITLDSTFYVSLDFTHTGTAELENKKVNTIEAISKGGTTYRLFFDEKTHLLSLLTKSWKSANGKQFEQKSFYSNYKEVSGLLVAHKIVTQSASKTNGNTEIIIKSLKVNPEFKSDTFKVRK